MIATQEELCNHCHTGRKLCRKLCNHCHTGGKCNQGEKPYIKSINTTIVEGEKLSNHKYYYCRGEKPANYKYYYCRGEKLSNHKYYYCRRAKSKYIK